MKPQDELKYLKGFIQLTKEEAIKRDSLELFLENRSKVLLLDADSLLFNVVNFNKDTEYEEDLEKQYEDFHAQVRSIAIQIEEDGFEVEDIVYFFTTCTNNFRKKIDSNYKANRPDDRNRFLVSLLKHYTIQMLESEGEQVKYDDKLEADDLIAQATYFFDRYIICSIDKDLKQLEGAHFDYYKKEGEYKGWSYTTKQEGYVLLLKQLLVGDSSDNIKGVKGIGEKKATKLLANRNNFSKLRRVAESYNDTERLRKNIKLIKL